MGMLKGREMKELHVNHQIHIDAGFRILSLEDVEGLRPSLTKIEWPVRNEPPFDPKGITVEEAQEVLRNM